MEENAHRKVFMQKLKVNSESEIGNLVLLLKTKKKSIGELTEVQKQEAIKFLQKEISIKKSKLKNQ